GTERHRRHGMGGNLRLRPAGDRGAAILVTGVDQVGRAGGFQRRSVGATGQSDHCAAQLPGQRQDHRNRRYHYSSRIESEVTPPPAWWASLWRCPPRPPRPPKSARSIFITATPGLQWQVLAASSQFRAAHLENILL